MKIRLLVFAFCLALIAGLLPGNAAQAGGEYGMANCITDGGGWTGSTGTAGTGDCFFDANSSVATAACGADSSYTVTYASGFPTGSNCTAVTTPLTPQADCVAGSGIWTGSSADTGQCYYDPTTGYAMALCHDFALVQTYVAGVSTGIVCVSSSSLEGDDEEDGPQDEVSSFEDEAVMLTLGGDSHANVTFPPSACPQKCTVSRSLPAGAKSSLPDDAMNMLYVRVVSQSGYTGGTYTVCFDNPKSAPVVIYKFIGDTWVPLTFASTTGRVCVNSTGEGAFYVGS